MLMIMFNVFVEIVLFYVDGVATRDGECDDMGVVRCVMREEDECVGKMNSDKI